MSEQQITCSECRGVFIFTAAEQAFYAEKQLAAPPKRCKTCRQARKAGRGPGGPSSGPAPRRFSGDVNEYRSPMSGGGGPSGGGGARGARGAPAGAGNFRGRGDARGAPVRAPVRARGRDGVPAPAQPRSWGAAVGGGNGPSERRSPAFPQERSRERPTQQARGGVGAPSREQAPGPPKPTPRAAPPRPERAKFDIACGQCGAHAQVPFKPLEGREVFCQDCYRARRGLPKPAEGEAATSAVDVQDSTSSADARAEPETPDAVGPKGLGGEGSDNGIVE